MTQEQINRLAREYAENKYKLFSDRISPIETWREVDIREFKQCVDFLLRDHLIVEKSKTDNLWQASQITGLQQHDDVVQADAVADTLKYLFPDTFNPTEK